MNTRSEHEIIRINSIDRHIPLAGLNTPLVCLLHTAHFIDFLKFFSAHNSQK